jgi:S1-C subfamily serine protease
MFGIRHLTTAPAAGSRRTTHRLGLILGATVACATIAAFAPTAASAGTVPTPSSGATGSSATASSLSQAETLASPSVVLINYEVSATAQNVVTGKIYDSYTDDGPLTTSFIGTGFFVSSDGFIVTAAHLAAPTPDDIKQVILTELYTEAIATNNCDGCGTDPAEDANAVAARYSLTNVKTKITVYTQNQNLANKPSGLAASLVQSSPVSENDTAVIKVQGSNFPVLTLADSSAAKVGDAVGIIGYPSTAISNVDLSTVTSPTITSGTITNKNKQNGFDRIQSDATAEHGNSGGPLINASGAVVGIVSNGPTSTTNFLIPSNAIKDVMRQAGVDNSTGKIDAAWRTGLTAFAGQHYKDAAAAFQTCVDLNPVQVGCASYHTQAVQNLAQDVPANGSSNGAGGNVGPGGNGATVAHSSSSTVPIIIGGGVALLIIIGLTALLVTNRRKPATPAYQAPAGDWYQQQYAYAQTAPQPAPHSAPAPQPVDPQATTHYVPGGYGR